MDKIKTVKIKNEDGSISEESYTISVDARNVDMDNGKDLQDTIGTVNIDTDGNIAEQLENLNDNVDNLNIDIKKKAYFFNTVADMKKANLKVGDYACTLGYYETNDGGAANYRIVSGIHTDDGGSYHQLGNSLYAELIVNDVVNVKQFGAYGDNIHDDIVFIQNAINYCFNNNGAIKFNNGVYKITNEILITKTVRIYGEFKQGLTNDSLVYGAEIKQVSNNKSIFKIKGSNYGSVIENLRLAGDGNTNQNGTTIGISQEDGGFLSEFTIKNVHFSYYLKYGIVLDDCAIGIIDNCDFGENNIGILLNKATRINITNCNLWNNVVGFKIKNVTDLSITDNWIEATYNDSLGILLQAPSRVLFSSLLNNTFNMKNTCIKFDGTTNITEYMCFEMFNMKNNRFTGSAPFIIDMKNESNVKNNNADNRWNITIENCVFNNVTSDQAIDFDFDYLGLGGLKLINCRAYSSWYGGNVNMFKSGESNTATQNNDNVGFHTNGALHFDSIVNYAIATNNSIYKSGSTNKLMIKDNDGNVNAILVNKNGNTSSRPVTAQMGEMYYDTTIGKPLWWNGNSWKDSNGNNV